MTHFSEHLMLSCGLFFYVQNVWVPLCAATAELNSTCGARRLQSTSRCGCTVQGRREW